MKPYRPSNGSEGCIFESQWCMCCLANNICRTPLNAMIYEIGDPQYPKQWIYKDGKPTCTSFRSKNEKRIRKAKIDKQTGDLFRCDT